MHHVSLDRAVHSFLKRLSSSRSIAVLGTILLIVLVLMLLGAIPAWPHSRSWGYGPSGGLGLLLIVVVVLLLMGRI
jgi:hypothetical protein